MCLGLCENGGFLHTLNSSKVDFEHYATAMTVSRNTVSVIFILALMANIFQEGEGKWVEDNIDTSADWVFITRFCFLSKTGKLTYNIRYPKAYGVKKLVFYYDVPGQWDSVYKRGLTCGEKIDALGNKNQFPLQAGGSMCVEKSEKDGVWYECIGDMDFNSARERWWFVVISRCGPPANSSVSGMKFYYKLHMTNGDDLLHKEFSADEFYILLVDIIFFILYIKIIILSIICAVVLMNRQLLHTTYKMYMASVTLWTLHLLCMVIAWGYYGSTGWEIRPLEVFGRILQAVSNIIFMLMLILLAKGFTIVRGRLTNKAVLKITVFINLYIIATVVLFIWEGVLFDPGLVLYYYESPPGYGMVVVILIGWLWLTKASVFTLKHFSSKTYFYIAFYSIYTVWFWAGPVVILIAMFSMAKWTREKSVNGVQQFIAYLGHLIFLIMTMPHKVNDNFPYHIKTTQIGAMTTLDGSDESVNRYSTDSSASYTGTGPNLEFFVTANRVKLEDQSDDERLYKPLELKMNEHDGSSPPPSYPLTPLSSQPLPKIDKHDGDIYSNVSSNNNATSSNNPLGPTPVSLPPLKRALHGSEAEEENTLPPIRGTGLPALVPCAQNQPNSE